MSELIYWLSDKFDRLLFRVAVFRPRRGFGADCPDYAEKCASCEAKKVIEFLEGNYELSTPTGGAGSVGASGTNETK